MFERIRKMRVVPYKKAKKPPRTSVYLTAMHLPQIDIVGHKIQHIWKDEGEVSIWKGTILEQVGVNPAFYLIQYDGRDRVYGLELYNDKRVQALEILNRHDTASTLKMEEKVFQKTVLGKNVTHAIDVERRSMECLIGVVLSRAPIVNFSFYITYENYPVLFIYDLMEDYKNRQLRIEPTGDDSSCEIPEHVLGKRFKFPNGKIGKVIKRIKSRPSLCLIRFKFSPLVYIYQRCPHQEHN